MIAPPFPYTVIDDSEYAIEHKNNDEMFGVVIFNWALYRELIRQEMTGHTT